MMDMIGEEVVPINARLIAVELCPAMYTNVLNKLMPVKPVQKKYALFCFTICQEGLICFHATGSKRIQAVNQRKKARAMGGISLITARATMKLPLQMMVASMASTIPSTI